jgi:hypothetical protein
MTTQLTPKDLAFILESLEGTKIKFEAYEDYPSYEFKLQRIKEVDDVIAKVKAVLKEK